MTEEEELKGVVGEIDRLTTLKDYFSAVLATVEQDLKVKRQRRDELAHRLWTGKTLTQKRVAEICGLTREWVRLLGQKRI